MLLIRREPFLQTQHEPVKGIEGSVTAFCRLVDSRSPPPQPRDLVWIHKDRVITLDEALVLVSERLVLDPGENAVPERRTEDLGATVWGPTGARATRSSRADPPPAL